MMISSRRSFFVTLMRSTLLRDPPQLARFRIGRTACASQQFMFLRLCPIFELELRPISGLGVDRAKADNRLTDNNLGVPYFDTKVASINRKGKPLTHLRTYPQGSWPRAVPNTWAIAPRAKTSSFCVVWSKCARSFVGLVHVCAHREAPHEGTHGLLRVTGGKHRHH